MIIVCPLARLVETVSTHKARRVISLLGTPDLLIRPPGIAEGDHLYLEIHDIAEACDGHVLCGADHIETALAFIRGWDRAAPLVVHCWAGISRSTAMAYLAACALHPDHDEHAVAQALRAASPTAYPNRRIVALGDEMLGRGGRMTAAVEAIGRGRIAEQGEPFALPVA